MFKFLRNNEGVAAVEFALIAVPLTFLMIGLFDYGMYLNTTMKLENTAWSAAVYVTQGGDPANLEDDVLTPSGLGLTADDMAADYSCTCRDGSAVSCDGTCDADASDYMRRFYEVSLDMDYQTLLRYPGMPDEINLTGHTVLRVN